MCKYINITYEYVLCMYVCFRFIHNISLIVFLHVQMKHKQNRTFETPILKKQDQNISTSSFLQTNDKVVTFKVIRIS